MDFNRNSSIRDLSCYSELESNGLEMLFFLNSLKMLLTNKVVSKMVLFCKKIPNPYPF